MAKAKTEAKAPPKKISKGKPLTDEDVSYQRPLLNEPENDPDKLIFHPDKPKVEILKGKILKGDKVSLEYTLQNNLEEEPATCTFEHTAAPHVQLKKAFAALSVHAALIGEFIPLTSINNIKKPDPEAVKDYNVSGFTVIAHGKDDEGVILTAQRTLKSGKAMGFNTPKIVFQDESDNAYSYLDELSDAVETCKEEMLEYLNGKHAEDPQLKMDLK